jgi:hypothetical protein
MASDLGSPKRSPCPHGSGQHCATERRILLWVLVRGIALSLALAWVGSVMARRFTAHGVEGLPENERAEPRRPKVPVRTGAE